LLRRTDGWITGLQMAAVSMKRCYNAGRFIEAFAGTDRHVQDYLIEEVLHCQPADIQTFLLHTSVLRRLSGPLCDAVLARPAGSSSLVLQYLERANLFIVTLDIGLEWYRYHRLFAELLASRLEREQAHLVPELHLRAAAWFKEKGHAAEAVHHYLAARSFEQATRLIERQAEHLLMRNEGDTLLRWIESLPDEVVRARPRLCVYHAVTLIFGNRPPEAIEMRLRDAASHSEDSSDGVAGEVAAYRGILDMFRGGLERGGECFKQALLQLKPESRYLRGMISIYLGLLYMMQGQYETVIEVLEEAARMALRVGNITATVGALSNVGTLYATCGRLHQAADFYRQALRTATDDRGEYLPVAGKALLGLGDVVRQWSELEDAERYVTQAIGCLRRYDSLGTVASYTCLAWIRLSQARLDAAETLLDEAAGMVARRNATELDDRLVLACQARLKIIRGDLAAAADWASRRQVHGGLAKAFPDLKKSRS